MPGYISEVQYEGGGDDFIEIVVPSGTDISGYSIVIYDTDGTIESTLSLGTLDATNAGNEGYVIDETDPGFVDLRDNSAIALVDDSGNVVQFLGFKTAVTAVEGPANGQTSDTTGDISSSSTSVQTYDGGATYSDGTTNAGTIPCYAPGTMINTPDGARAVETLKPGDMVMTQDHGPQPIRWTRSGDHLLEDVEVGDKPVQIKAGALGRNLPVQDLVVSPQHRILVGGAGQLDSVFASEALAPANSLTGAPGIRHMKGKVRITWIHFACERHEVVTANGCLSESLLLGPMVVNRLSSAERQALTDLFGPAPTPDAAMNGPAARECLKVGEVKRQIAKHLKEKGKLVAKEIKKWDRDLRWNSGKQIGCTKLPPRVKFYERS